MSRSVEVTMTVRFPVVLTSLTRRGQEQELQEILRSIVSDPVGWMDHAECSEGSIDADAELED